MLSTSSLGGAFLGALLIAAALVRTPPAEALVVENLAGTTVAPTDDPGWNFVTQHGSRSYVYLGDGWALSAFHVGAPGTGEPLKFSAGSYPIIKNQPFTLKNPNRSGV